jgi:hypothetical protein
VTTPSGEEHATGNRLGALAAELKVRGTQKARLYPEIAPFGVRRMWCDLPGRSFLANAAGNGDNNDATLGIFRKLFHEEFERL